jgi:acyl-coenzyme A synthetase/AMP-(fatty) acid ligase
MIFFTSGTTGRPKKWVLPAQAWAERLNNGACYKNSLFERVLMAPGLGSYFGFGRSCDMLRGGKTVCFAPPGDPAFMLISTYRIDALVASTQQAQALADLSETGRHYDLRSLQSVSVAGAFVSKELVARIQKHLCRHVTVEYGSTEAGMMAFAPWESIASIPDAVGFPVPWMKIEIVDENDSVLAPDTDGRIRCQAPVFVKSAHANHPELRPDSQDVWWYPGDVGHLTPDGVLCVGGRNEDVINRGGTKMSANAIEEALLRRAEIADAAACGVANAAGVMEVWIAVVPRAALDAAALRKSVNSEPGFPGLADEVFVVDRIPRGDLGKLLKEELKTLLTALKQDAH